MFYISLLVIISAFITAIGFHTNSIFFWCIYFSLIPIFYIIDNKLNLRKRDFFYLGTLFGFIFMGYLHHWILSLVPFSTILSIFLLWFLYSLYLSLFYAFLFLSIRLFRHLFAIFPLWILFELIKSYGQFGNPHGNLGYSQAMNKYIVQLASIGSVYIVSLFILIINFLLYLIFKQIILFIKYKEFKKSQFNIQLLIFISLIAVITFWSHHRLMNDQLLQNNKIRIAIVQPNHSQSDKLNKNKWLQLKQDYLTMTNQVFSIKPDLIFWPETITPQLNYNNDVFKNKLFSLSKSLNCHLLFGTPFLKNKKFYNSIISISPNQPSQFYFKQKLIPFGEYWPAKSIFQFIGLKNIIPGSDYTAGTNNQLFTFNNIRLSGAICLESVYPHFFNASINKDNINLLFVVLNNAWFFNSAASQYHLNMSIFRAVETNRFLIQSANTGISAIIDNNGKVTHSLGLNQKGILQGYIYLIEKKSIFTSLF
ncbi:apolipoprotein N-acyltransferase [Candidatus Marinamargulisbacteria bacterium SCGC AG-410-N11]|nr:apolipoprotein N-acyltransferase [Candidatus Marinamargulisbacteria bacterium SCGC AG-410-N11]